MTQETSFNFRPLTKEDTEWLLEQTKYIPSAQFSGIAVLKDGQLVGAVGLDHWTATSVCAHMALSNPRAIVPLWTELVQYLRTHGWKIITGVTPGDNVKALRLIRRLGWKELFRQKDGWKEGIDMVFSEYRIHE